MEIYLGADHRGWELKKKLRGWLQAKGYTVHDLGADKLEADDDYPRYAFRVAEAVAVRQGRGIVICGSGAGMAIAANKVPGVRAVLAHDEALLGAARQDDDVNVLALGADFIAIEQAEKVVEVFLQTSFEPSEPHERRLNAIRHYEQPTS